MQKIQSFQASDGTIHKTFASALEADIKGLILDIYKVDDLDDVSVKNVLYLMAENREKFIRILSQEIPK